MYGSCDLLRLAIMKENELGLLDPVLPLLAVMILTAIVQQSIYTGVLTPDQQREIHLYVLSGDYTDEELELLEDLFDAICTGAVVREDV